MNINFEEEPWSILHPSSQPAFRIIENKAICDAYPDGIFPGASSVDTNLQSTKIYKFQNYIEFSKITEDEITNDGFLTTKFYIRRRDGWQSRNLLFKKGKVIGYCVNCYIYHVDDIHEVYKTIYGKTYLKLIEKTEAFKQLRELFYKNKNLKLQSNDEIFITEIRKLCIQ